MGAPPPMSDQEVELILEALPDVLPCLNPTCTKPRAFRRSGQGRQPFFCSTRCRTEYSRVRRQLSLTWARLLWTISHRGHPKEAEKAISQVEWLLQAYGDVDVEVARDAWPRDPGLDHFTTLAHGKLLPKRLAATMSDADRRELQARYLALQDEIMQYRVDRDLEYDRMIADTSCDSCEQTISPIHARREKTRR